MNKRKLRKRLIKNRRIELLVHGILLALAAAGIVFAGFMLSGGMRAFQKESGPPDAGPRPLVETAAESAEEQAETDGLETLSIAPEEHGPYPSPGLTADPIPELSESEIEAVAEQLMSTEDGSVVTTDTDCDWRLILVNPTHCLPDDFTVETEELEEGSDMSFDVRAVESLRQMIRDCEEAGLSIVVRGAYRTMEQQQELFDAKVDELMGTGMNRRRAEKKAATIVAYPGTSEHQLGLAADIVSGENMELSDEQADTPTQQWLMENSWKYGFVLRYPTRMSHKTGIIYEPWHYRYVGDVAAQMMHEENLCLEEFLAKYGSTVLPEGTGFVSSGTGEKE